MDNDDYKIRHIPENFGNGINIAGFHFRPIFLVEGVLLAVIMLLLSFYILRLLGMNDIGEMLGICLVFAGLALFLGIKGINDEPLTTFLRNLSQFNKRKRTAYYNPRIKLEAKSIKDSDIAENRDVLPRDKILSFFNKYKEAMDKKQQEKAKAFEDANGFDHQNMFFEDDIGVIKKPRTYFSEEEENTLKKKKKKVKAFREKNL